MRAYSKWLMLVCLSVAACSDDKSGSSDDAVSAEDASTSDSKDTNSGKKSGSAGKSGSGGTSSGSGGKSAASSGEAKSSSASGDNAKSGDGNKDNASDSADKNAKSEDEKKADSSGTAEDGKSEEGAKSSSTSAPTNGDQLSVCSRAEGDCNKGLACQAPATLASPGRGFCSKICEADADCGGVSPEGTKYTCGTSTGGTNTCEIVCSGADDKSCPSGLSCVQTGRRRAAPTTRRPTAGAGGNGGAATEAAGGAGGSAAPQGSQGEFRCRYPFEVSKTWGQCGDAAHVCDKDLTCQGFWFGGIGHCTHSCESDADCQKPDSGNTKATCRTIVPAFGENAAVKQCALNCVDAKNDCPNGLSCIEGPRQRAEMRDGGTVEAAPTAAWCQ